MIIKDAPCAYELEGEKKSLTFITTRKTIKHQGNDE